MQLNSFLGPLNFLIIAGQKRDELLHALVAWLMEVKLQVQTAINFNKAIILIWRILVLLLRGLDTGCIVSGQLKKRVLRLSLWTAASLAELT